MFKDKSLTEDSVCAFVKVLNPSAKKVADELAEEILEQWREGEKNKKKISKATEQMLTN